MVWVKEFSKKMNRNAVPV